MFGNQFSPDYATLVVAVINVFITAAGVFFSLLQRRQAIESSVYQKRILESQEASYRLDLVKEFRNSDIDDTMMQIRNYLRADYFITESSAPLSIESIFGEYKIHDSLKESRIHSMVLNKQRLKANITLTSIETDLHELVENSLRQFELLRNSGVDNYEYNNLLQFQIKALGSLMNCKLSLMHAKWSSQLNRAERLLD